MIENMFTPEARDVIAQHFGWAISPNGKFQSQPDSPTLGELVGTEFCDAQVWEILMYAMHGTGKLQVPRLSSHAARLIGGIGCGYYSVNYPHKENEETATAAFKEVIEALESDRWNRRYKAAQRVQS